MVNWKNGLYLALIFSLWGCGPESYMVDVGFTNGSTTGEHGVTNMSITSESGGKANFAMGAISSYPGAHSSGGRMGVPVHIDGYWAKGWEYPFESYHRISAAIPKDAEAKMKVMDNYYKNFKRNYGSMQVIVDGPRVRVFYTKGCSITLNDCTPKKNGDPNGWVVKDPKGTRDIVVLFDGVGETSATPFPDTHFSELESRKKANQ
ncbi:hypothetical protein [Vibrio aestuarianus]|uniref:hypothetical protein n=1 Tax=Vibrio aestuarianus TaxID=28171 RepID=UPI0015C57D56|nr:hypothetical protein [Vibrio aestuarianus]MDE1236320.1 hypothetical protein [Vibrio aestuarianus]MDE1247198.1 hypothetical protein [Vibrio aestuarianus]NGZ64774.1 hypothetical protein [Vibrio aestuarianus subsp. cardii]NGZ68339.1 hypothetical protein [Vibrio aestuarianus subsp. cardii]